MLCYTYFMIERIIFDWKRTLYDPSEKTLLPGAEQVLRELAEQSFDMILIGKGQDDMDEVIDALDARKYFRVVHFVAAKSDELFGRYIPPEKPETSLVVGDRAQGEIAIGKSLGARAIWVRSGQFSDEMPLPDVPPPDETIEDIASLLDSPLLDLQHH